MANKSKFQAIRGTRDLLRPKRVVEPRRATAHGRLWHVWFSANPPAGFEPTELFAPSGWRRHGHRLEEMYTFIDREGV